MRALMGLLCLFLFLGNVFAVGDHKPEIRFSGHVEGLEIETERFVLEQDTPDGPRFFRKVPEFTQKDIAAYRLVDTPHGQAVAIRLNERGQRKLEEMSLQHQGRGEYLLLAVNGAPREFQRIDQPIEDGIVILWEGLAPDELEALDAEVRHNNR